MVSVATNDRVLFNYFTRFNLGRRIFCFVQSWEVSDFYRRLGEHGCVCGPNRIGCDCLEGYSQSTVDT